MENTKQSFFEKVRITYSKMSKKQKTFIALSIIVVLAGSAVITYVLNRQSSEWIKLFPGMTSSESGDVYSQLKKMNIETKVSQSGEIEVRKDEWDKIVYELAEKGYPQSTPSYGTFFDNLSMTMSDFEKKQALRFELQDRLQDTISRIDNIRSAVVTISVPQESSYVWDDDQQKASASVMLTFRDAGSFDKEQAAAVKKLVAYSAQQMNPDDVAVIDASTGMEIGTEGESSESDSDTADPSAGGSETRSQAADVTDNISQDGISGQKKDTSHSSDSFTFREVVMMFGFAGLFIITIAAVAGYIRVSKRNNILERENEEYVQLLESNNSNRPKKNVDAQKISRMISEDPKAAADILRKMMKDEKKHK